MEIRTAPRARVVAVVAAAAIATGIGAGGSAERAAAASPRAAARALCAGSLRTVGTLADPALTETSGLAWSRAQPGVRWAHNDSGDSPRVFAVGPDGAALGPVTVVGASATDWEDMAIGRGPGGRDHLFLGDIGGAGAGTRSSVVVYRIPEPTAPGPGGVASSEPAAALTLTYPDGAHDAEALLVDDRTGDLVVVTKGSTGEATVYRAPGAATAPAGARVTLEAVGPVGRAPDANRLAFELAGRGSLAGQVTAADASPAGRVAVVRTYAGISVFRWPARRSLADALVRAPCAAPAPLHARFPQGETIALAPDGRRALLVSEGHNAPLVTLRARP